MSKYFDQAFFRFLFGFLFILALSFVALYASQHWGKSESSANTYVEIDNSGAQ